MERRFTKSNSVRLESSAEGDAPKIVGVAAVYYDGTPSTEYVLWDFSSERAVERIMPGTFTKALSRPDDVRGLLNHDPDNLLGRTASKTMKLSTDSRGLNYEITPADTTIAKDLQTHLKRGDISGSSFAFDVDEERWTETKDESGKWHSVREILSVTLYDVSPVTFPAYTSTTAGTRATGETSDAKKSLDTFRAALAKAASDLQTKLTGYASRARLVELEQH